MLGDFQKRQFGLETSPPATTLHLSGSHTRRHFSFLSSVFFFLTSSRFFVLLVSLRDNEDQMCVIL